MHLGKKTRTPGQSRPFLRQLGSALMRDTPAFGGSHPVPGSADRSFTRGDKVHVGGGERVYTVLAVGAAGLDVLVTDDPDRGGGTWVAIGDVSHVKEQP